MQIVRILITFGVLLVLSTAAIACGDDDDDDGTGDDNGGDATTGASDDGGGGESLVVTIIDFSYDPEEFAVPAGEEVTFEVANDDDVSHTFTVYRDAEFNRIGDVSVQVDAGEGGEGTATFEAGEYFFRCELHPSQMQGSFVAE
jgi:plastocyanin